MDLTRVDAWIHFQDGLGSLFARRGLSPQHILVFERGHAGYSVSPRRMATRISWRSYTGVALRATASGELCMDVGYG